MFQTMLFFNKDAISEPFSIFDRFFKSWINDMGFDLLNQEMHIMHLEPTWNYTVWILMLLLAPG